jgi:transcription factor IIIB subunit 2
VDCCQLSYEESQAKERIWLIENEDWLRQQQERILVKALDEARGNPKKPKQKRRKQQQMGDGSILEGQPAASADEAAKKMLQKRAKHFSSHINYDVFKDLMPTVSDASSGTATPEEQTATPIPEQLAQTTYQVVPVGAGDDEADDEEYEAQDVEEEEDLEQEYMSDEEEGFDQNQNYDDY